MYSDFADIFLDILNSDLMLNFLEMHLQIYFGDASPEGIGV